MDVFVKPTLMHVEGTKLTVADAYAVIPLTVPGVVANGVFSIQGMKAKTLILQAATKDLNFRVECSHNGTSWSTVKEDYLVLSGYFTPLWSELDPDLSGLWHSMRVSVKPDAAGQNGTGSIYFTGGTL